jgi:hypothetical protein
MKPRTLLALGGLVLAGVLLVGQVQRLLDDPTVWPPDDFVEYWAAGRLCLGGQDPYSPELLLPLERSAGRETDEAVMMWNPPWALTAVMPLAALPPRVAQFVWLLVCLGAVGLSADRLWRAYRGPADRRWVGWAAAFTFMPVYLALHSGQIGPLVLLGVALFVWLERTGRPALAGAATVLLAIKPHLAYLVWLAILTDALVNRRWKILTGGLAAGLVAAAVPLAYDPHVYAQYAAALRDHPPAKWVSLTLGTVLRLLFGEGRFALQFVPVLAGVAWFAARWRRYGRTWDWGEQLPLLLLVSFVTSPYGAWHFDLVLLLVPVLHRAARLAEDWPTVTAWAAAAVYLAANAAMLVLSVVEAWSFWFAWVTPLILVMYLATGRRPDLSPRPAVAPA